MAASLVTLILATTPTGALSERPTEGGAYGQRRDTPLHDVSGRAGGNETGTYRSALPQSGRSSTVFLSCSRVPACQLWKQVASQRRALALRRLTKIRQLHRDLSAVRRRVPSVDYAYRLASAAYNIPLTQLRAVAACESNHYPYARNGQYRGLFQEGPMFERGPYGQAGFSVYDPIANALTAGHAVSHDGGWHQWSCAPR